MDSPYNYIKPKTSPLVRREQVRYIAVLTLILLLLIGLITVGLKAVQYKNAAAQRSSGLYRTEMDFITGGKRFLDYFYSLNAATVEYDHYRAMQMMTNPALAKKRKQYLIRTDFFRRVEEAQEISSIDWEKSTYNVLSVNDKKATVVYTIKLDINRQVVKTAQITLNLISVPKSDRFPDGIGVASWIDAAKHPFKEDK